MSSESQDKNDQSNAYIDKRQSLPKPVNEGDEYDVTIETLGTRGDGIAKIQGLVIFIKNVKPKDQVKIKITCVRSNFATAEVIESLSDPIKDNSPIEKEE